MADDIPTQIDKRWDFVNLPHTWNAIDGQDGGNDYWRGTAYYAKAFDIHFDEKDCICKCPYRK